MDPNSAEAMRENLRGEEKEERKKTGGREEERRKTSGRQEEGISTRRTLDILKIKVLLEEHRCCMKTTSEVLKLVITG